MQGLINLTIGIILLYIVYKVVGAYVLPLINDRRLQRYKEQFYRDNPHVDRDAMELRERQRKENESIIDKRRRAKKWF